MTLIEVAISLALLALIVLTLMGILVDSRKQVASTAKVRTARHAANSMVSVLRAQSLNGIGGNNDFRTLLADWDVNNVGAPYDAPWPGGAKGVFFNVPGLPPRLDGLPHGQIHLFLAASPDPDPAYPITLNGTNYPFRVDVLNTVLKEANVVNLAWSWDYGADGKWGGTGANADTVTLTGTPLVLDLNADGNTTSELPKDQASTTPPQRFRVLPIQVTIQWGDALGPQVSIFTVLTQKNDFKRNTG